MQQKAFKLSFRENIIKLEELCGFNEENCLRFLYLKMSVIDNPDKNTPVEHFNKYHLNSNYR